jgi:tetratricopeptide (TPR) repeat protein
MGLLGDAMSELQVAKDDPAHRIGSLQLMALCALDLGEPEQAMGHLQDALSTPDLSADCELSLQLDLGKSCEAAGDIEAARSAYQEVQTREPGFADVESRLAELEARIVKEEPEPEPEVELRAPDTAEYEAFDGFLDDLDEEEEEDSQTASEAEGNASEPKSWETFDDVIAEVQAEDDETSTPVPELLESVDSVEAVAEYEEVELAEQLEAESVEVVELDAEEVVDLEAEEVVEPDAEDVPATKLRKKKISFV